MNANQIVSENKPSPAKIRDARSENPKMRERDFAQSLGISELELIASYTGFGTVKVEPRFDDLFSGLQGVGEVMALTRNESAVHEKIGIFEKFVNGRRAALMLGEQIDTRMFPVNWVHGFAVEKDDGKDIRRSLQFFDAHGDAVQKIHARPGTDKAAWDNLIDKLLVDDKPLDVLPEVTAATPFARKMPSKDIGETLKSRWEGMTDVHQFHGILKELDLDRLSAFELAGNAWAWPLDLSSVTAMLRLAASEDIPIMCFVGNRGCIQIHSGPIATVLEKGPWINVMDPTFHLHLRTDHIHDVWLVRKPSDTGHVTSVEAYNRDGQQIIQFYGVRGEGNAERSDWRDLAENLPKIDRGITLGAAE